MAAVNAGILFADVSGSTALYSRIGDEAARRRVCDCLACLIEIAEAHHGRVVKTVGDAVLCAFPTAESLVQAACAMQMRSNPGDEGGLAIRIGINFGPVIEDAEGDVFGNTVNLAARLAALAREGQILAGGEAAQVLQDGEGPLARLIDVARLKGFSEPQPVHEVLWRPAEVTRLFTVTPAHPAGAADMPASLSLDWSAASFELPHSHAPVRLGRSADADIQIVSDRISRVHCLIEPRRNGFFLTDRSTNGTYVQAQGGDEIFLRGEGTFLIGSGTLGLGLPVAKAGVEAVRYRVH